MKDRKVIGDASKWPTMMVVRLIDGSCEMRIGEAHWSVRPDHYDAAGDFLDQNRKLWDMRVVWADPASPVDADCAKSLLQENERLRNALQRAFNDMFSSKEATHVALMRVLHGLDPDRHGPVPDEPTDGK